jgi:hypothetical protein
LLPDGFASVAILVVLLILAVVIAAAILDVFVAVVSVLGAVIGLCSGLVGLHNLVLAGRIAALQLLKTELEVAEAQAGTPQQPTYGLAARVAPAPRCTPGQRRSSL